MQFTITYRSQFGVKFTFVTSTSVDGAKHEVRKREREAIEILTVRRNDPPLAMVKGICK